MGIELFNVHPGNKPRHSVEIHASLCYNNLPYHAPAIAKKTKYAEAVRPNHQMEVTMFGMQTRAAAVKRESILHLPREFRSFVYQVFRNRRY